MCCQRHAEVAEVPSKARGAGMISWSGKADSKELFDYTAQNPMTAPAQQVTEDSVIANAPASTAIEAMSGGFGGELICCLPAFWTTTDWAFPLGYHDHAPIFFP